MANVVYAPGAPGFGGLSLAGREVRRSIVRADTNNVGLRFGLAWQMESRTVVRGGYGIFFGQDEAYGVVARPTGNPPVFVTVSFPSDQINPNLTLRGGFPADTSILATLSSLTSWPSRRISRFPTCNSGA